MIGDLVRRPVIVAPMAGGIGTTELVTAAAAAGATGFLPGGYKTARAMRADIDAVEALTDEPFGVNVFVPGPSVAEPEALSRYLAEIAGDAAAAGAAPGPATWDDDDWQAKIADLTSRPVPIVSFTFGCPEPEVIAALRRTGTSVWVTVTDSDEAAIAARAGADCLCVQGTEAGAHRGTFANRPGGDRGTLDLVVAVRAATEVPLVAAGGFMTSDAVVAALSAGAVAVQCGTAFLRCPESGANPAHKAALADPRFHMTAVTRAFSGRPARGLLNDFMRRHQDAPAAYPEINNATRPIRFAAAEAGDQERMSLWAGQGYRAATTLPAGEIIEMLCR
ncbi:MAG: nitronate monooxygenase [Nocardiopsaceae bacterium]|jgi:nitronate monooxygenase|nr:nitronate monooxygenase [Nocardiopsaceae bacterium]